MEYKIKGEQKEVGEFDKIIEITGLHSEVTINQLLDHYENTDKVKREQEGQFKVNEVLMQKAMEELPLLKKIPDDKYNLALSFFGKAEANRQSKDLIATCEATLATYKDHLESIEKQTGITCVPKPFIPNITVEKNG